MLGIHLQASSIISMPFAIITTVIWFYTEPILILLHQDTDIAKMVTVDIRFLILGLFAYGFLRNILRFIQAQSNCVAPGQSHRTTIGYSCWNCICTGHLSVLWEHQWQLQFHNGYQSLYWPSIWLVQRNLSVHGRDFHWNLSNTFLRTWN